MVKTFITNKLKTENLKIEAEIKKSRSKKKTKPLTRRVK